MKVSEVTLQIVKDSVGFSGNGSDALFQVYMDAALSFITGYTGLTAAEIDTHEDLATAYLCLVGDMFLNRYMWKEGSIKVNGEVFHYLIKQYDKGSEWGIDGGRISKFMLKRDGKIVCNYDRGWDIEPADENTQLALELLLHSENW